MIKISNLQIMQDSLRNVDQIAGMYEFVKSGGRFDEASLMRHMIRQKNVTNRPKRIGLLRLTGHENPAHNGKLWLRDGNHRTVAISFIRDLHDDEYYIEEMPYSMMTETNFDVGWVTPFDPLTHVRKAEFGEYRKKVYEILKTSGSDAAEAYIRDHLSAYTLPRTFSHETISHLADPIWLHLQGSR